MKSRMPRAVLLCGLLALCNPGRLGGDFYKGKNFGS